MDIQAKEFYSRYMKNEPLIIVDVREDLEFQTFNLGGDHIPLQKLADKAEGLGYAKDSEIIVICQHGIRSETARKLLTAQGYKNVRNLKGGIVSLRKLNIRPGINL